MSIRLIAVLALAFVLSGCGESSSQTATAAPGPTRSSTGDAAKEAPKGASNLEMAATMAKAVALPDPKPIDIAPCTLVTEEDAGAFFKDHKPVKEKGGTEQHPFRQCMRSGGSMGMSSVLVAVAGGLDVDQFDTLMVGQAELARQQDKMRRIDGIGDRAYWLSDFLWVQTGSTTFYVSISTIPALDSAAALEGSQGLAKKVLARL